jgi:hypothetical protein
MYSPASDTMKKLSFLLILVIVGYACNKDPKTVPAGKVRVLINVNHHGFPIANAVVFRKTGTLVFPGQDTTLYEERYVCDANGSLVLENQGSGYKEMVFYAKGYDSTVDSTQLTAVWGYQYTSFNTAPGEDKDISVSIPVSE